MDTNGDPEANWIAFKEEHFEVVEQMPLTLFRQYRLIGELDGQVQGKKLIQTPTLVIQFQHPNLKFCLCYAIIIPCASSWLKIQMTSKLLSLQ